MGSISKAGQTKILSAAAEGVILLQIHHVLVRGGPGGYEKFVQDIRDMFAITEELDMHLAFDCADPVSGTAPQLCLM